MRSPSFADVMVVGMHFRQEVNAKAIVESFVPPVELQLEREPENPYDSMAIKVFYNGAHIGYIERGQAAFIAPWMDQGVEYSCTVTELCEKKNNLHPLVSLKPVEAAA